MSTVYYAISNDQYLSHHGVLGMKWGVRKRPRYIPHQRNVGVRRYQNKDANLTPAGKNRRKPETVKNQNEKKKGLTDKQKKILIIGGIAVGTALAAYGVYKLNNKAVKSLSEHYKNESKRLFESANNSYHKMMTAKENANMQRLNNNMQSYHDWYKIANNHRMARDAATLASRDSLDYGLRNKYSVKEKVGAIKNTVRKVPETQWGNALASKKGMHPSIYNSGNYFHDGIERFTTADDDEYLKKIWKKLY